MKKTLFIFTTILFFALALTSCKKDEVKNNGNNNSNTENPGGGNQEYPSTAVVIHNAVTDIDGNSYDAVQIGNQVWMAENLRTTKYADGTAIAEGTSTSTYIPLRYTPSTDVATYGYLYNWPAVMHGLSSSTGNPSGVQGVCPNGWHVPSDAEWTQLTAYVGSHSEYVCNGSGQNIAKALASNNGWQLVNGDECAVGNNPSTNNATGFSALPAGFYDCHDCFGVYAYYWSATMCGNDDAWERHLSYGDAKVQSGYSDKVWGFSVRCVRD